MVEPVTATDEPTVPVRPLPAAEAAARVGDLLAIYHAAFTGPPWHETAASVAAHSPTMLERLHRPQTHVVVAESGERLLGAAYGWPAPATLPDADLYHRIAAAAGPQVVAERLTAPAFEIVELIVHPDAQRRGLGRRLLDTLRAGRPAWLLTHADSAAAEFYRALGWSVRGRFTTSHGHPMLLFVHD